MHNLQWFKMTPPDSPGKGELPASSPHYSFRWITVCSGSLIGVSAAWNQLKWETYFKSKVIGKAVKEKQCEKSLPAFMHVCKAVVYRVSLWSVYPYITLPFHHFGTITRNLTSLTSMTQACRLQYRGHSVVWLYCLITLRMINIGMTSTTGYLISLSWVLEWSKCPSLFSSMENSAESSLTPFSGPVL